MLGIIFAIKKQWDLAEFHYRNALDVNPEFVPATNNLAYLLAEQDKNLDEALRLSQKASRLLPDDPRVLDTLGWVYVKLGFYEEAIAAFSKSIEHIPENPTLNYHLGIAYYQKGATQKAKSALKQALKLDDNFSEADQAREILSKI
jgi:tetratricopeptide (TPR) repeat protein